MFTVYLGGAITKDKEDFCREWRDKIIKRFYRYPEIEFINPIEGKDLNAEYKPKEIFEEDMESVKKSDLVVVEMDCPNYHYIGSSIEIHKAWQEDIPVIVWGKAHTMHYFLRYLTTWRVDNMERAVDIIFRQYHDYCQISRW